jgi:hypothetical protein
MTRKRGAGADEAAKAEEDDPLDLVAEGAEDADCIRRGSQRRSRIYG